MASNAFYQAFVEIVPEGSKILPTLNKQFASVGPSVGKGAGDSIGNGMRAGILGSIAGLAAPLAVAVAGLGIGNAIKDSIANASDFAESGTAVTAVFGDADKTIQEFAKGAASALGQSTNMTLDAARTFGVFGKAAGLTGQDLAGFSTDFITLAADLASFNNTTPEEAIEALGAGLRGESEPLRKYGVLLDDAALKARATELGIYSGTGALTQQQKVLASQAEIMAQTSDQQGDFARTSGGLANQQRILSAGVQNLSASFGRIFLPVALAVVGFLNRSVIPALDKAATVLADFFADAIPAAKGLYDLIGKGDFTKGLREATGLTEDSPIVDFLLTARDKAIEAGSAIQDAFGPAFTTLGDAIGPLIPKLVDLYTQFSPFSVLLQALVPLLPQMAPLFEAISGAIGILIGTLVDALPTLLPALLDLATVLGDSLATVIEDLAPLLPTIVQSFADLLVALLPLVPKILELVPSLLELVPPITKLITEILPPLVDFLAVALPIGIGLFSGALDLLKPVLEFLVSFMTDAFNVISLFIGLLTGEISFQGFIDGLLGLNGPLGFLFNLANDLGTAFGDFAATAGAAFGDFARSAGEKVGEVVGFLSSLPQRALDALGSLGTFLVQSGADLIQGFIDGIEGALGGVGDAVGGVMDFVGGFFPNSPAERGQFSGSGWTRLLHSGEAIGTQFGAGLERSTSSLGIGNVSIPNVAGTVAGVAGSRAAAAAAAGSGRAPIAVTVNGAPGQSAETVGRVVVDGLNFTQRVAG